MQVVWCAEPFVSIYYSSQFAPLVVFFLIFLAVVRNTKLHHFVRFNAMQVALCVQGRCLLVCAMHNCQLQNCLAHEACCRFPVEC